MPLYDPSHGCLVRQILDETLTTLAAGWPQRAATWQVYREGQALRLLAPDDCVYTPLTALYQWGTGRYVAPDDWGSLLHTTTQQVACSLLVQAEDGDVSDPEAQQLRWRLEAILGAGLWEESA